MNKSLRDLARASGFKVNFLAIKIGVKPNYLAMCLRGERNLAEDKCKKLKDFLEAIPA
jgi:hypothetical protein